MQNQQQHFWILGFATQTLPQFHPVINVQGELIQCIMRGDHFYDSQLEKCLINIYSIAFYWLWAL